MNTGWSVVTGAGGGLGRALALSLGRRGGRVLVSDVSLEAAEETAQQVQGAREVRAARCDVTRLEDVEALAEAAAGTVDLLVNNAGVSSAGRVGELSLADWRWTLEVDLFGVVHGCHVFVPRLRAQRHGHVLNVASVAGIVNAPDMAAYNVAKAGVISLSETLHAELVGSGVGVTVLCPSFFQTNIVSSGRFVNAGAKEFAQGRVRSGPTAGVVADAALAAVDTGTLHVLPMADARWAWRLKRAAPGVSTRGVGLLGRWLRKW